MTITKSKTGNKVRLSITGTIDTVTSQELNTALLELDYSELDLTLDFSETDYITSAGLRVLLIARKKLSDETMKIIGVNPEIDSVFRMTGFNDLLNYSTVSDNDTNNFQSFKSQLKEAVETEPSKTAFVFCGREYSALDVEKASQIIASDLSRLGVKKGSHVGICAMNSINWVFAFYAVQKLGAIAVLVNYGLKPAEIVSLSEIGDITHICYGEIEGLTDFDSYKTAVTQEDSGIKEVYNIGNSVDFTERFVEYEEIKDDFAETYHVDDASVIIYTSGSTGKPKAVLLSSFNLISSIVPMLDEFKINGEDRNCAFLPFFHVFGFSTCIVAGILKGMVSYIPENNRPETLLNIIEQNKCTLFHSVPTMVLAMTKCESFSSEKVSSLRASALGGSAITPVQMEYLMRLYPNNHFANVYGMSENAAISITGYGDTPEHITGTVGKPLPHVELEIRDPATGEKLPVGRSGEVCIRSSTMIICYYKMSVLAQPLDDEGWLSTGDLGVLCEDGYLKLVGRAKDLIIRGGENISPREVADAVASAPEIADVKVVGIPDDLYGEEVAAAVILEKGSRFDEDAMRKFLSFKLAKFKIPRYFSVFESFPLLGSGKTDDKTIKAMITEQIKNK